MKIEIKSVSSNISFYLDAQIIYRWKKRDVCMNIKRFIKSFIVQILQCYNILNA